MECPIRWRFRGKPGGFGIDPNAGPSAATTPCDDGDPCTEVDVCSGSECVGSGQPEELCDGEDNNCDGVIDDDCPCTTGGVIVSAEGMSLNSGDAAVLASEDRAWQEITAALPDAEWIWGDVPTPSAPDSLEIELELDAPEDAAI